MIYLKDNPKGIDLPIQIMQQYLYDKLVASLNCEVEAYGRAYKDRDENDSIKPRVYLVSLYYKVDFRYSISKVLLFTTLT